MHSSAIVCAASAGSSLRSKKKSLPFAFRLGISP